MSGTSERAGAHPAVRDSKAVLFDFDFTLADSSVGIIACINYALARIGLPESPPEAILKTVGCTYRRHWSRSRVKSIGQRGSSSSSSSPRRRMR